MRKWHKWKLLPVVLAWIGSSSAIVPLSKNCKEEVLATATDPIQCARMTREALGLPSLSLDNAWKTPTLVNDAANGVKFDTILNMWVSGGASTTGTVDNNAGDQGNDFDPQKLPGTCRWDTARSNSLGNAQACMCPIETEEKCKAKTGCSWHTDPTTPAPVPSSKCLNNAERFYFLLDKLLKKRGKNDFAIKIKYAGSPKNSLLPEGMLGKIMMVNMLSQMMGNPYTSSMSGYYGGQHHSPYHSQPQNQTQTIWPPHQYQQQQYSIPSYPQYSYSGYSRYPSHSSTAGAAPPTLDGSNPSYSQNQNPYQSYYNHQLP